MAQGFTDRDVDGPDGPDVHRHGREHRNRLRDGEGAGKARRARVAGMPLRAARSGRDGEDRRRIARSRRRVLPLDQADLGSVRAAAAQAAAEPRLDVLVNNAGIMMPPRALTVDGFESQFAVNHLGTFALTAHLLPKLEETEGSRVVITSSLAHRGGRIHWDDIDAAKLYGRQARYQQSKLANLLHMHELDRRLKARGSGTIAVGCHPGLAQTEIGRHFPLIQYAAPLVRTFFNSQAMGAWPTLMAATAPSVAGSDYYGPCRWGELSGPAAKAWSTPTSRDPKLGKRLWELSVEMTGVDPGI